MSGATDVDVGSTVGPGTGSRSGRDARTEKVLEAINRVKKWSGHEVPEHVERAPEFAKGSDDFDPRRRLPPMALPGFGEELEDCGEDLPHFCTNCGHTTVFGRTCGRSTCPRCASTWCRDRASTAVGKLWSLKKMLTVSRGRKQHLHHVVFSPPKREWQVEAGDPLERTFSVVKEILEEMQAQGVVAYHPWSGRDGDDRGKWKNRLFKGRDWEDDVREELELRPHFHAIVVSDFIKGGQLTKRVEEETGWLIKRIANEDTGYSIDDSGETLEDKMEEAASATTYTFSHTGLKETDAGNFSAQYRYVGADANTVDVYDDVQAAADRVTRKVAHKTLGIPSANMTCGAQVTRAPDDDAPAADVLATPDLSSVSSSSSSDGDGFELDDPGGGGAGQVEQCRGALVNIGKAPSYLEDENWRRLAQHAAELEDVFEEWREYEDWIG